MNVTDPRTGEEVSLRDSTAYWAEISALFSFCSHPQVETREWTNANGAKAIVGQCLGCGKRIGNPLPKARAYPAADDSIAKRFAEDQQHRRDEITIRHIDRAKTGDAEWWVKYKAYLKTPEWHKRRERILQRCGGICEGWGDAQVNEVHHLTYEHVGREFLFELVGLCEECHRRIHDEEPS